MHYFISDTHLGAGTSNEQRRVEKALLDLLARVEEDGSTLFLVGDIFDFWFEYKEVVPKGFTRILGRLAELSEKGIRIVMFTGNHDMWVGDYLTKECGIELYTKPNTFELAGKRLFVAHGDNMNIKRQPMLQLINSIFRSRTLRFLFSWLIHPDLAMRFGKWWSGKSRKSHGAVQTPEVLQPLIDYVAQHHKDIDADHYIFGHMHLRTEIEHPQHILFMGDWHTQPNYLVMDDEGKIEVKYIG